eukprot:TRINITY_DN22601_c0_g1_i1.p1 TRINITY_DN22601_c0_g1~~TRINITY_DN22601_c0_g1_i1.p1  ORF type:complete len:226 (+),score=62.88 TRINITY_DN22601_c0_g1_i1:39-716(+)
MSGRATASELLDVMKDPAKLKEFGYSESQELPEGFNNEEFHLDLPYEDIKAFVANQKEVILSKVPEEERKQLVWEHIGSTSIKGMPGTKFPDALLIIPEFPPSEAVVKALLDSDFYFSRTSPLDAEDLWFVLNINDGFLKYHKMTIHVCLESNTAGRILKDTRDMCNTEKWAFEDYKNSKIEAAKAKSFIGYKMAKGSGSKLLTMLREKHSMKEMNIPKNFDGRV